MRVGGVGAFVSPEQCEFPRLWRKQPPRSADTHTGPARLRSLFLGRDTCSAGTACHDLRQFLSFSDLVL